MLDFISARKFGPQIQRVCPYQLGRADKGVYVSEQRAVMRCSQIGILTPN
jgi:hypothetical protein